MINEYNNDRPFFRYKKIIELFKKGGVCNIEMLCQCGGDDITYAMRGESKKFFELENNTKDSSKFTYPNHVLQCYLLSGNTEIIKYLTEKRNAKFSEIDEKNFVGGNALFAAAISGNLEIVTYLISKGLEIKEPSAIDDQTLLHAAAYGGNLDIFKLFLNHKSQDIKAVDKYGRTVLHHAVRGNSVDVVKSLVNKGFDLTSKNKNKQTALEYAKNKKDKKSEIIKILQEATKEAKENNPIQKHNKEPKESPSLFSCSIPFI